ncbi:hypothetical protein C1645_837806 [Glomus cerebriforme]|uniref:Uncharacterized protein n=1 Tax=Glomus cerebriforme TaxID=658196 RepID=A0A397S9G4_9GLOM|nr:hypothetical protein C1645_837806 [Glomus cerebriforme]
MQILIDSIFYQFNKINSDYIAITRSIDLKGFEFNMTLCSQIFCQNIFINYSNYTESQHPVWVRINITDNIDKSPGINMQNYSNISDEYYPYDINNINNESLILRFESFQFLDYPRSQHTDFQVEGIFSDNYYFILEQTYFLLYPGQVYFITLDPTIFADDFVVYSGDLNFLTRIYKLELNPQLKQMPINLSFDEIHFGFRPHSYFFKFEENHGYNFTDLMSDLGGFYNAILGIFISFFGTQRLEPWGLAQKYIFSCIPCRKSFMSNLAKKFVSSAGIPLAEKVNERPVESSLEERVQILETLLKDYYLDDYYLKKIKKIKIKHKRLLEKFNNMEQQNNENDELENPSILVTPSD